jgi:chromosome segregation ATPase
MKKGAVPQLDSTWWEQNKGKTVPNAGLTAALKAFESMSGKIDDKCRTDVMHETLAKLDEVAKAVKATLTKCNKKLHQETMEALERYDDVIDRFRGPIEKKIAKIEDAVEALDSKSKEHAGKLSPKWQEFAAIVGALRTAVEEAEKTPDPAKYKGWEALANSAAADGQQKFAEVQQWAKEIEAAAAKIPNRAGYSREIGEAIKRYASTLATMDGALGRDIKPMVGELKEAVKVLRKAEAERDTMMATLKSSVEEIAKVADLEDSLFRQLEYKLQNFKATSKILREAQKKYGAELDGLKKRREAVKNAVLPLRGPIDAQPRDNRDLVKLFNEFQAVNARIGEGNGGVEKQIREILAKDYERMAKKLESQGN